MLTARVNKSSCFIDFPFVVVNKVLQPYFYHEKGNPASCIKHLFPLSVVHPALLLLSVRAKRAYQHTLYQFHLVSLLLKALIFVSYIYPFSVFLDVPILRQRVIAADSVIHAAGGCIKKGICCLLFLGRFNS